ncbi:MAG: cytochrome P450 [Xanthobacteraceae bacterium]
MKRMFADVRSFRHNPLDLFARKGFGAESALVRLDLGLSPVYLVTDAGLARTVLKFDEEQIDKGRLVHKLRKVIGVSSITMSGVKHQSRRQVIHQHLARGIINEFVPEISGLIRRHASLLVREEEFVAHEVTASLALRVIASLLFGRGVLSSGDELALIEAVYIAEAHMADSLFRIFPRPPLKAFLDYRKLKRSRAIMSTIVDRVRSRATSTSLIAALESLKLGNEELRDEILLLLLAGHHTTGNAAAWVLYFIATQPGLADKIRSESLLVYSRAGEIDPLRLPRAEISLRVARETLRLYPPFYWFSREVKTPIDLAGCHLRKGTSLIISPWLIQRDARNWREPNTFRIDRTYNSPAFLPFGLGPRACVGIGLGLLELQLLALEIASACDIEVLSEVPAPAPAPAVTLVPPRIRLRLRPRSVEIAQQIVA